MKEFFSEFIELLANCVLIICLAFSSFLLLVNLYHYRDLSYVKPLNSKVSYDEYKKQLARVDKKMKSVNIEDIKYSNTAKPIFDYYSDCKEALYKGTFAKFDSKTSINAKDLYDANNEILKEYNGKCIFYVPYNINSINKHNTPSVSFDKTFKLTEEKRKIVIDSADYLTKAGLGNSSYSFATDTSRSTIYNKVALEYDLTVDNYKLMVSILNDVADWYVAEFGGNN